MACLADDSMRPRGTSSVISSGPGRHNVFPFISYAGGNFFFLQSRQRSSAHHWQKKQSLQSCFFGVSGCGAGT
jgi:hypothetical protein